MTHPCTVRMKGNTPALARSGNVLLLMLGLITVMVIFAYSFLRSMQQSREGSQLLRQQKLANLAADMGLQHAIAVCLHEYGMSTEFRDGGVTSAASRIDSLTTTVFGPLSPRLSHQPTRQQPPTPWDLGPDVSFQNLYSLYSGTYNLPPNYNAVDAWTMIRGYSSGWTNHRGYARFFEANRFDYSRGQRHHPATYNDYDLSPLNAASFGYPDPAVVTTPFPPVDPFARGQPIVQRHRLDNPLWLDANYRPVSMDDAASGVTNVGSALARYRQRYAICILDQSPNLWLNTDPTWIPSAALKADARMAYKNAIYAVGVQFGWSINHTGGWFTEYGTTMENVFLGHGQYANARFDGTSGIPLEWPSRGGGPMYYRSPYDGNQTRAIACVHGSPFMTWFDNGSWKGSALTSWNDLAFAIRDYRVSWHGRGENTHPSLFTNQQTLVRADPVSQRVATPFGRPYESATTHPWQVNLLTVPMRTLEALVAAYVPPAVRGTQAAEQQIPWVAFDATAAEVAAAQAAQGIDLRGGFWATTAGSWGPYSWQGPTSWTTASPMPGPGIDLFTDAFAPGGISPFAYPTPADQDYWTSPASARPRHGNPDDTRSNAERYPGPAFFDRGGPERFAQQMTCWADLTADPPQVESDSREDLYLQALAPSTPAEGIDSLGRHIVFYDPASNTSARPSIPAPAAGNTHGYLSAFYSTANGRPERWATPFSPIQPFSCDRYSDTALGNFTENPGEGTQCFRFYPRGSAQTGIVTASTPSYTPPNPVPVPDPMNSAYPAKSIFTDPGLAQGTNPASRHLLAVNVGTNPLAAQNRAFDPPNPLRNLTEAYKIVDYNGLGALVAPNSYWNRVSVAFVHAIMVSQIANLAWAAPADARNTRFWPADGYLNPTGTNHMINDAAGIIYNPSPRSGHTVTKAMRKGPTTSWNPAEAHFSSLEQVDRQFLANLGESFDHPGRLRTSEVRTATDPTTGVPRPPRYTKCTTPVSLSGYTNDMASQATPATFGYGSYLWVGEYHVTNNIRTLLTPVDGTPLTPLSTQPQPPPPRLIWLLDEWKGDPAATDPDSVGYTPGSSVTGQPTPLARARAKLMERVLNDWRMSFFGSAKSYVDSFRPKDFDGDGKVFCSGYVTGATLDPDTNLTCWQYVDAATVGDGPGIGTQSGDPGSDPNMRLTVFSVTGCLTLSRSHHYKILVRGELYDNVIGRAVAEKYLESALLVDPDNNVVRSSNPAVPPQGLGDSTVIMQRPIHNYYRGYLSAGSP